MFRSLVLAGTVLALSFSSAYPKDDLRERTITEIDSVSSALDECIKPLLASPEWQSIKSHFPDASRSAPIHLYNDTFVYNNTFGKDFYNNTFAEDSEILAFSTVSPKFYGCRQFFVKELSQNLPLLAEAYSQYFADTKQIDDELVEKKITWSQYNNKIVNRAFKMHNDFSQMVIDPYLPRCDNPELIKEIKNLAKENGTEIYIMKSKKEFAPEYSALVGTQLNKGKRICHADIATNNSNNGIYYSAELIENEDTEKDEIFISLIFR